jgi:hypothetical protein
MQDEETPRTDRPAEGMNLPLPGIKTAHDIEEADEHFLMTDTNLDSNELHADGRICPRCGLTIGPEEDVRRTASGAYQHEFCQPS